MRRLGIIAFVAVMAAVLTATPVTVAKKAVNVPLGQPVIATQALTVPSTVSSISVPALAWSNANAFDMDQCDPSGGRHQGLAYSCFLLWLMEVFDASNSPSY